MSTIEEIDIYHCDNFVGKNSSSFIFRPELYKTYGAARKAMNELVGPTGYALLTQKEKEIVGRWSLVSSQSEMDNLFNVSEQEIIQGWHNSQILKLTSSQQRKVSSSSYQIVDTILYNGNELCQVSVSARGTEAGTTFDVRVYDGKNMKVIIEKTGCSNTTLEIIQLKNSENSFDYQPTIETELEIHIKKTGGSTTGEVLYESSKIEYI